MQMNKSQGKNKYWRQYSN